MQDRHIIEAAGMTRSVIENGKVKECGSHMQLMELDGLYAEMFRSQAQWYTEEGSIGYEEK